MNKLKYFTPDLFVESVFDIPIAELQAKGIKLLLFDLDNTLTEYHNPSVDLKTAAWVRSLEGYGLQACLFSNNKGPRVAKVAEQLGIPFVPRAQKPRKSGFKRVLALFHKRPQEVAIVGDQLLTDTFGGRRAGIYTILVKPISPQEFWGTRHISRRIEKLLWPLVIKNRNC